MSMFGPDKPPHLEISGSRLFASWLDRQNASLAFTTYQAGKIFMIGVKPDGRLSIYERSFARPMGIGVNDSGTMWVSGQQHLWRFENFLAEGETKDGADGYFVPLMSHLTGDVDIHDVQVTRDGRPFFVVTRANAIATLDATHSFLPVALPPFIDRLAMEDRCHLNGLALRNDRPAYATAVSQTNMSESWRDHRQSGGVVIDLAANAVVCEGLSMPHSPRLAGDTLWMLNSGTGELGRVDLKAGRFEPLCFLPGFARGLSILGEYAVVSVSKTRENRTFSDLAMGKRLERDGLEPQVGLVVVNLGTGDIEHRLMLDGMINEIYDCVLIPRVKLPVLLGQRSDETRFVLKPGAFEAGSPHRG